MAQQIQDQFRSWYAQHRHSFDFMSMAYGRLFPGEPVPPPPPLLMFNVDPAPPPPSADDDGGVTSIQRIDPSPTKRGPNDQALES